MPPPVTFPRAHAPGSSRHSAQSCRKSGVMPRETHTFSAHVDLGTLTRVDPGQIGAVGGRDRRAHRTVALSYTGVVTQTACWEERSQVCDEIRITLAEVRRRTPSAEPAWGPRGTTPRLTVRGTTAGAPPPPPPLPAMRCLTALGQWALQLLQCTASPPWGSGQWNSCNALPQGLGAVGSATSAKQCPTACRQWAVQLLQCTASMPSGSRQCNSCNAPPHCLGAVGSGTPATTASTPGGSGQCNFRNALPQGLRAVGTGPLAIHCLTALGQWALDLLHYTASLPGGNGQCNSGVSCRACGDGQPGAPAWGDGESCPGGGQSVL